MIPEQVRTELTSLMQNLLMKCHELSFEYSTSDCEEITNCPLAKKCKELFKIVKQMNELFKRAAPSYVT